MWWFSHLLFPSCSTTAAVWGLWTQQEMVGRSAHLHQGKWSRQFYSREYTLLIIHTHLLSYTHLFFIVILFYSCQLLLGYLPCLILTPTYSCLWYSKCVALLHPLNHTQRHVLMALHGSGGTWMLCLLLTKENSSFYAVLHYMTDWWC